MKSLNTSKMSRGELIEKIIEYREKAKKWDEATSLESYEEFLNNKRIVELLKKELKWFNRYYTTDSDWSSITVRNLLQKILGEEKC